MPTPPTLKLYRGGAKTLLCFDLPKNAVKDLAGFTIHIKPAQGKGYYQWNTLQFEDPTVHAQDPAEPPNSSVNAPIHKFRWLHVPGSNHQGLDPYFGNYTYTVTARYFKNRKLLPMDPALSAAGTVEVGPLRSKQLEVAFTRGFTQSQAFTRHFGEKAPLRPKGKELVYDTRQMAGKNKKGEPFTWEDQYAWMGFTARKRIHALLDEVLADKDLRLDVFAYDLNETGVVDRLLKLAKQKRVRVILDNAALHHSTTDPKPEDEFQRLFMKAAGKPNSEDKAKTRAAGLLRGHFARYAHNKVFVVYADKERTRPRTALSGSTNFSLTGLYVNSNHVLVFDDPKVAARYAAAFEHAWTNGTSTAKFKETDLAKGPLPLGSTRTPNADLTFSPREESFAWQRLHDITARMAAEKKKKDGSILFAVMELEKGSGPLLEAIRALHGSDEVLSYGISDSPNGIQLYEPKSKKGLLVTGKPAKARLPKPFDQVRSVGLGHQVHHKFIVCGFTRPDAVVYCGSSNLALLGEQENGDNLLAIHDPVIATAFAIEAMGLVDHFQGLHHLGNSRDADKTAAAQQKGWHLSTTDRWVQPYYDTNDLRCVDREMF